MKTNILCESCSKRMVCKFRDDYMTAHMKLSSLLKRADVKRSDVNIEVDILSVGIACTEYEKGE